MRVSGRFLTCCKDRGQTFRFLKAVCKLDPDANPTDAVPIARPVMLWEICRKRTELEAEVAAKRAADRIPPPNCPWKTTRRRARLLKRSKAVHSPTTRFHQIMISRRKSGRSGRRSRQKGCRPSPTLCRRRGGVCHEARPAHP